MQEPPAWLEPNELELIALNNGMHPEKLRDYLRAEIERRRQPATGVQASHKGAEEFAERLASLRAVHGLRAVTAVALLLIGGLAVASAALATMPSLYSSCAHFNARYPHGVGKVGAREHSSSGAPVTNFKRSNVIFAAAMSFNRGLDRDHDNVACEQA